MYSSQGNSFTVKVQGKIPAYLAKRTCVVGGSNCATMKHYNVVLLNSITAVGGRSKQMMAG